MHVDPRPARRCRCPPASTNAVGRDGQRTPGARRACVTGRRPPDARVDVVAAARRRPRRARPRQQRRLLGAGRGGTRARREVARVTRAEMEFRGGLDGDDAGRASLTADTADGFASLVLRRRRRAGVGARSMRAMTGVTLTAEEAPRARMSDGEGGHDPRRLPAVAERGRHRVQPDDEPRSDRAATPTSSSTRTLESLREKGLSRRVMATGQRVVKHRHVADEGLGINAAEFAVLGVLLLRGAQTPGELKGRTERWHRFRSLEDVEEVLDRLAGARAHAAAAAPARAEGGALGAAAHRRRRPKRRAAAAPARRRAAGRRARPRAARRDRSRDPSRRAPAPHSLEVRDPATGDVVRTVAITEPGEIAQKVERARGARSRRGPHGRTRSAPARCARSASCSPPKPKSARSVTTQRDGQADPAVAQRGRGGARAHRLERRARRRRDRAADGHRVGGPVASASRTSRSVSSRTSARGTIRTSSGSTRSCPRCSPGTRCCTSRRSTRRSPGCGSSTCCTAPACRSTSCTRSSVAERPAPRSSRATSTWCASPARTRPAGGSLRAAAERLVRVQLELGGKDAAYVCDDVDVESVAVDVAEGAFYNAGSRAARPSASTCTTRSGTGSSTRSSRWCSAYAVGDPTDDATDLGPLARAAQLDVLDAQIADAAARGARVADRRAPHRPARATGSSRPWSSTSTTRMALMRDESFGPVIGLARVRDDDEAIARMDDTEYGLGASVFTRDRVACRTDPRPPRRRQRLLEHRRPLDGAPAVGRTPPLRSRRLDVGGRRPQLRPREGLAPVRTVTALQSRRLQTSQRRQSPQALRSSPSGRRRPRASASKRIVARRSRSYCGPRRDARRGSGRRSARTRSTPRCIASAIACRSGAVAGEQLGAAVEVVEHERDLERVRRPQHAAERRRLPREEVHPHRTVRELRLGEPDGRDAEHARRSRASVQSSCGVASGRRGAVARRRSPARVADPRSRTRPRCRASSRSASVGIEHVEQRHLVRGSCRRAGARPPALPGGDRVERRLREHVAVDDGLERKRAARRPRRRTRASRGDDRVHRDARSSASTSPGFTPSRSIERRAIVGRALARRPPRRRAALRDRLVEQAARRRAVPSSVPTLPPPADSPKIVTWSGSPPNAAMQSRTHSSAATWSRMPALPEPSNSSPNRSARCRKPNGPRR